MLIQKRKLIIISIVPVLIISFIYLIKSLKYNYDGKYISELSSSDRIAKYLLKDIQRFKESQNGKGGFYIDKSLKIAIYRLKPGDNLWDISKKTGLSIDTLLTLNNLDNVHIIQPGTEIRIPNKDGILYKISPGETLETVAKKFNVSVDDIIDINDFIFKEEDEDNLNTIFIPGAKLNLNERINYLGRFIMPLLGRITSGFGYRRNPLNNKIEFHTGIDIASYYGAPVKAAESGTVIFSGTYKGYGNMVIIKHNNRYSTRYAHLSKINVEYGDKVRQGQIIGYVGTSGSVTGPHLHFEIRVFGKAINPYFNMRFSQK